MAIKKKRLSAGQIIAGVLLGLISITILAFAGVGIYSTVKYAQDQKPAEEETEKTPTDDETQGTIAVYEDRVVVQA